MKKLIGAAIVIGVLALAGPAVINSAAAAPQAKTHATASSDATDLSARRRHYRRYHRYGYRPYYHRPYYGPYYYARPYYYRPYPYYYRPYPYFGVGPFGFGFGVGVGPYW